MSFRYLPHAILFIGTFFFLVKGIFILNERKVRVPFTLNRQLEGKAAVWVAIAFFVLAVVCVWDFVYIILSAPSE